MPSSPHLSQRLAAVRAELAELGSLVAEQAPGMEAHELFEVTGQVQGVINAAEGVQLLAVAHAAAHETRLTDRGPVDVHHGPGFVDAMAPSEMSLATGVGQWAAGRKVGLAAALSERFPRILRGIVGGELASSAAQKIVSVCQDLDVAACAAVEAVLVERLPDLDPDRVTTVTRRVATRIAADQMAAGHRKNRRDRCVQVSPGPDGTTTWWAQLPAGRSAAAWAAITTLGDSYAGKDPTLTPDQARADAFLDLLLTNVDVTAKVTIGIPVITGDHATATENLGTTDAGTTDAGLVDGGTGPAAVDSPDGEAAPPSGPVGLAARYGRPVAVGGLGLGDGFSLSTALAGCELPGIGFIDADTIETLLATVPLEVGRALLDARTGTLIETTAVSYRPPKALTDFVTTRDGTCRMWGCSRPARRCDLDHVRPWPAGHTTPRNLAALCRRHHRLKQRRRWSYHLARDGTVTWTSPTGKKRVTLADHAAFPPPTPPLTAVPAREREPAALEPPPF